MGRAATLAPLGAAPPGAVPPGPAAAMALVPGDTLGRDETIGAALAHMGDRYGTIILVVDRAGRLEGIALAGDLRKAILGGHGLTTPLAAVMRTDPVTIQAARMHDQAGLGSVLDRLRERYSAAPMMYAMVPVVDEGGLPRGLIDLQSLARATKIGFAVSPRSALVIGSMLTRKLIDGGWSVTVFDSFLYGTASLDGVDDLYPGRLRINRGDVRNIDTMVEAVSGVDAAIYLAELVGDPAVSIAPQMALKTNYLAATALAHLCAYLNVNCFVYSSSCSVYGASADPNAFLTELSSTAPLSLYGKMKLLVKEAILATARQPNQLFAPTILRLGTVFELSHRARFDLVVNTLVKEACKHGRIRLFGGDQWRPQVHLSDVASAILHVLEAPLDRVRAETFNVGDTAQNHTIATLGDFAAAVFPGLQVIREEGTTDPRSYRVSCDKMRDALGFRTSMSVPDGMKELKGAIESGRIADLDAPRYSNHLTVRDLAFD